MNNGVQLIDLKRYTDERGFFTEVFNTKTYERFGINRPFVQDNQSLSKPGVLRGLHFQRTQPQGKLVSVMRGKIYDVVVDLRTHSSAYGKWEAFELSENSAQVLWIPPDFAHGFCVVGPEPALVLYKTDAHYAPQDEGGIRWNDPDLKITWPIEAPILSAKDAALPFFSDIRSAS